MARLAAYVIQTYPQFYRYFGETEFTWNGVRQHNRNPLLTMNIGADGMKTGHLAASGFGLVGSAVQNGHRLILVLNGARARRSAPAKRAGCWNGGLRRGVDRDDAHRIVGFVAVAAGKRRANSCALLGALAINERATIHNRNRATIAAGLRQQRRSLAPTSRSLGK